MSTVQKYFYLRSIGIRPCVAWALSMGCVSKVV